MCVSMGYIKVFCFLAIASKACSKKGQIDKLDFMRIKNFCTLERQATGWEKKKIFAYLISDKEFVSRYTGNTENSILRGKKL